MSLRRSVLLLAFFFGCTFIATALPTAVELQAEKIFKGVSPQAQAWILGQARSLYTQPHLDVEAIRLSAAKHFAGTQKLTADQQNEVAMAVVYQVMKLEEERYQQKTGRLLVNDANLAGKAERPGRWPAGDTNQVANPKTGGKQSPPPLPDPGLSSRDKMGNSEIKGLMSSYNEAQVLLADIEKQMTHNTSHSIIGKL